MENTTLWIIIGFVGQGLFTARFFVQWLYSEKVKRSVVPVAFWYFSLAGGIIMTAYAVHRMDPVFIVGQGAGLIVYFRNLMLIRKHHLKATDEAPVD